MTSQAAKGNRTRLTNHDLANLAREGHTVDEIADAHGYGAATIRGRLRDLGLDNDGQPITATVQQTRTPVVTWYAEGDSEWLDLAACATEGHNPETWFPSNILDERVSMAKDICGRCDVRAKCLDVALKAEAGLGRQYRAGIIGGLTVDERIALGSEAVA